MKTNIEQTVYQLALAIRRRISEDMDRESHSIRAHDALAKVLREKWAGKKLTKRIAEHFRAEMGLTESAAVHVGNEYGMMQLSVWGAETPWPHYDKRLMMLIAYDTQPTEPRLSGAFIGCYDPASFEYAELCHGTAAKERNKKRNELINNWESIEKIATVIHSINRGKAQLEDMTQHGAAFNVAKYALDEFLTK